MEIMRAEAGVESIKPEPVTREVTVLDAEKRHV